MPSRRPLPCSKLCNIAFDLLRSMRNMPTFFAVIGGLVILLAVILTEPVCREGFVASISFGGWICVPGYKPNR
jgi:hypothetical protein